MVEEWKDVVGFESFYKVSNFGNVYSYRAKRNMKLCDNGTGYYFVEFSIKGKSKLMYVHRLVAEAFISNPLNYNTVNHKDENKANNKSSNLEWCSAVYNTKYGTRTRRIAEKLEKAVFQCDDEWNIIATFSSATEAARATGIDNANITCCCKGKSKRRTRAGGFKWKYAETT